MSLKEHKKHSIITRPTYGNFARNEWAIVGTPCGSIKSLAGTLIAALSPAYKCAYVDASHASSDTEEALPGRLAAGAVVEYTDQINYHQLDLNKTLNPFKFRQLFSEMDLVLVNGNHGQAKAQVVVIDPAKEASLRKRVPQLTNVQLFLLAEGADEVFDFVKEVVPDWQRIPLCHLSERDKIINFFHTHLTKATPKLNGLVLAGGQSLRMGRDKGAVQWHGKEQRYFMADLLKGLCDDVFISCRPEQQGELNPAYKALPDTFTGLGPYGAILSAFREQPEAAWLVVSCDLPLLDKATLQELLGCRDGAFIATTFESPQDGFPEPLITIWEPKSYPVLLSFLSQGYTCPRKVLRNSDIRLLKPSDPVALMNVNTPEELVRAQQLLKVKKTLS